MFKKTLITRNACILFAGLFALMLWTSCLMPLTWDEGNAILRSETMGNWLSLFWSRDADTASPFAPETISKYCTQTNQIEGHPAGYVLLIAMGNNVVQATRLSCLLDEKTCYRFGAIFLFCIALTAVFIRVGKTFNQTAGLLCVSCIVLMPRVFAHAHIAACDSPLMSCWLLAWALFDTALKNKRGVILWGIATGLGFSMKFPRWIIPIHSIIFAAWEVVHRRPFGRIARAFVIGFPVAVIIFYLLNPGLWSDPVTGFVEFFRLNTHRDTNYNIPIAFLGTRYTLVYPLPWYNTLFWAAITIPSGFLFFLVCFVYRSCFGVGRKDMGQSDCVEQIVRNRLVLLTVLNFLPLMIIRALPGTPVHDGVRLFVAAFPFAGIMAGLGAVWLWEGNRLNDQVPLRSQVAASDLDVQDCQPVRHCSAHPRFILFRRVGVVCILLGSVFNLCWYSPQWLSYYNLCIGGLPGAVRSGMEATYYWDSLDDATMNWINSHAPEYAKDKADYIVSFNQYSRDTLRVLTRWGKLKVPCVNHAVSDNTALSVFQCRAGLLGDAENELFRTSKPVYRQALNRQGPGPWNLYRVPLIKIYETKDYIRGLPDDSSRILEADEMLEYIQKPDSPKSGVVKPPDSQPKKH
ncbi:MAG: glycosyltransferase family 39 protein [Thermoguttaceae bacterium]|nr:glycosyltransferase family 39 protein [Thermoguttaceae bacterium]